MVVYDVTSETSFSSCAKWLERVKSQKPEVQIPGSVNSLSKNRLLKKYMSNISEQKIYDIEHIYSTLALQIWDMAYFYIFAFSHTNLSNIGNIFSVRIIFKIVAPECSIFCLLIDMYRCMSRSSLRMGVGQIEPSLENSKSKLIKFTL